MLQIGAVVGYFSDSKGLIRAVVTRGPNTDGTWDLDVKPHVPISRITAPPGSAQDVMAAASMPTQAGSAATTQDNLMSSLRGTAVRPPGTVCFYQSATRGYIPARVQRFHPETGSYDLDCKDHARVDMIFWIEEGSLVEYHSSSQNRWVPSRVIRQGRQPGTFDLDCREAAEVQRIRPCNKSMGEEPATFTAMPGMLCYQESMRKPEIKTEGRDNDMVYEHHSTQMRLRPRSKTPEAHRRPQSTDDVRIEAHVKVDLERAVASGNPQAIQQAIKDANSAGINSGLELSTAMQALKNAGGRLERTSSVEAMHAPPSSFALSGAFPERQEQQLAQLAQQAQQQQHQQQQQQHHQQQQQQPPGEEGHFPQEKPHHLKRYGEDRPGLLTKVIGPKPTEDAGVLTRMLGPKPSEDAGLLTRVLGPKPTEESGILERIFGADHGIFGASSEYEDDPVFGQHAGSGQQPPPSFTGGAMQSQWQKPQSMGIQSSPPTDPHLHQVHPPPPQLGHHGQAPFDSYAVMPLRPPSGFADGGAPPTDPQLRHVAGYGSAGPQQAVPFSGQMSAPPTDPQMQRGPPAGYGGSAPPTDPQLQPMRHGHNAYPQHSSLDLPFTSGQAPPTDPQLYNSRARIS